MLAGLVLLVAIWWPFLSTRTFDTHWPDWNYRASYASYTVKSLFTYREIPYCGWAPQYQQQWTHHNARGFFSNPETEVLSPYVPFYAFLSFPTAVRVSLVLHLAVGVAGLYLLLTFWGVRQQTIVVLCAVLLFGSGYFFRHIFVGHFQFVSYTYYPLVLWLYLKALDTPGFSPRTWTLIFSSACLLAMTYYEGNVHPTVQFVAGLGLLGFLLSVLESGKRAQVAGKTAACLGAFVLLAGFKLFLGLVEYGGYHPPGPLIRYSGLSDFLENVLEYAPNPPRQFPHELGFYLGIPGAVLLGIGLLNVRRRTLPFLVCAVPFLLLTFAPLAPLLRLIPVLGTQRPARLRGEVLFLAVVLIADALSRAHAVLVSRLPRRAVHVPFALMVMVIALVVGDQANASRSVAGRGGNGTVEMHDAEIGPPKMDVVGAAGTHDIWAMSEGVNGFAVFVANQPKEKAPVLLSFPDIGWSEARSTLQLKGPAVLVNVGGRAGAQMTRAAGKVEFTYSSRYRSLGLLSTLVGLVLLAVTIAADILRVSRLTGGAATAPTAG